MEQLCRLKDIYKQLYLFERDLKKKHGLSINEILALCALSNGFETPSVIADEMGLSPARISRVLASLESEQFVSREFAEDDRRKIRFSLTAAGKKKISGIKKCGITIPQLQF